MNLRILIFLSGCLVIFSDFNVLPQRQMEKLDRGLIAIRKNNDEVFLSWRFLGTDPSDISFNIYRGTQKINTVPIASSTNYIDSITEDAFYYIKPVVAGVEFGPSKGTAVMSSDFIEIPLKE